MQAYSYTTWQDDVNVYISILLVYKIWIVTNWIFRASYFILEDFSVVIMNENVLSGMLLPDSKEIMLCPSFSLCRLLNGIELPCLVHLFTARCRLNNRRFIALKICQFMFGPTILKILDQSEVKMDWKVKGKLSLVMRACKMLSCTILPRDRKTDSVTL